MCLAKANVVPGRPLGSLVAKCKDSPSTPMLRTSALHSLIKLIVLSKHCLPTTLRLEDVRKELHN